MAKKPWKDIDAEAATDGMTNNDVQSDSGEPNLNPTLETLTEETRMPTTAVMSSIEAQENFDGLLIESKNGRVGINLEGGYVTSWKLLNSQTGKSEDILYQGTAINRTGIPPLFPNYGESRTLKAHGFGRNSKWQLIEHAGNKITMRLTDEDIATAEQEKYPFKFETDVTIELDDEGNFVYDMKVMNKGNRPMPISPGLHPYWAVEHGQKQKIKTEGIEGFNAEDFDWDNNPPDHVYPHKGKITVAFPNGKIVTIEDITKPASVIEKVVAWSQPLDMPDHDFACFEVITRGDNAIDDDPLIIQPEEEWHMKIKFSAFEQDPQKNPLHERDEEVYQLFNRLGVVSQDSPEAVQKFVLEAWQYAQSVLGLPPELRIRYYSGFVSPLTLYGLIATHLNELLERTGINDPRPQTK